MPPPGRHKDVRARVVELLAGTEHALFAAENGASRGNAHLLGVEVSVLREAAAMVGRGGRASRPRMEQLDWKSPPSLYRPLAALAHLLHMKTSDLVRSLLHAAMLTAREPSPRPNRSWKPLVGCEADRARLVMGSATPPTALMHWKLKLTGGLVRAITRRAVAHGATSRFRYINLWIADLVDGRLADLQMPAVPVTCLFDDERSYVLPAPLVTPPEAG